jgi:hypothetical protein
MGMNTRSWQAGAALVAVIVGMAGATGWTREPAPSLTLVDHGRPRATIIISPQAPVVVRDAVKDLQLYLQKMSGALLPIETAVPAEGNLILVGRMPQVDALIPDLDRYDLAPDGVVIKTFPGKLVITGQSDGYLLKEGTALGWGGRYPGEPHIYSDCGTPNAVYTFLDSLGCRWYMPGDDGEVVPRQATIVVGALEVVSKPDLAARWFGEGAARVWNLQMADGKPVLGRPEYDEWHVWQVRNRTGPNSYHHGHSLGYLLSRDAYYAQHPEWFAMIDGKRVANAQVCTSNPQAIATLADNLCSWFPGREVPFRSFPVGQDDLGPAAWCQCAACKAQYGDRTFVYNEREAPVVGQEPNTRAANVANGYLQFVNAVAQRVKKEYPRCMLTYYAVYSIPGFPEVIPEDNVMPGICHVSPHDEVWRAAVRKWERISRQLYYYTYIGYRLDRPRFEIAGDIRWCRQHKGVALYLESLAVSPVASLTMYLAGRTMWDTQLSSRKVLATFYREFYGPAARPMRLFFETFDAATRYGAPNYNDCLYEYPEALGPERVAECRRYISAALALADEPVVQRRIASISRYWEATELHVQAQQDMARWRNDKSQSNRDTARRAVQQALDYLTTPAMAKEFFLIYRHALLADYLRELDRG